MMEHYPFGRFMLSSGLAMCLMTVLLAFNKRLESFTGENLFPYVLCAAILVLVLGTLWLNRVASPKVAVLFGVLGWVATFVLLFIHFSNQSVG
jgi:hypothetical protein